MSRERTISIQQIDSKRWISPKLSDPGYRDGSQATATGRFQRQPRTNGGLAPDHYLLVHRPIDLITGKALHCPPTRSEHVYTIHPEEVCCCAGRSHRAGETGSVYPGSHSLRKSLT